MKSYGRVQALAGLDLEVARGVVYGFLGPNGAGKTTTIRCLLGLVRPDAGTVELLGAPFTRRDRRRLGRVGALIESPAFYPYLSGRDNLRVIAAAGPGPGQGRIDVVIDLVGLRDRAGDKVSEYSMGMRQRLGIAAALLNDPELLVLDEPANGLDPAGIVTMRETLRYLADQGKTVFVSSHILPEVQQIADVVGIIDRGKLVRQGNLAAMLAETGHVRVRVTPEAIGAARAVLEGLAGPGGVTERDGGGVTGTQEGWLSVRVAPDQAATVSRALAEGGIYPSGLESGNDLESLFLSMTGGA
jgi:ABC-2 type transport system ATP-binding protein